MATSRKVFSNICQLYAKYSLSRPQITKKTYSPFSKVIADVRNQYISRAKPCLEPVSVQFSWEQKQSSLPVTSQSQMELRSFSTSGPRHSSGPSGGGRPLRLMDMPAIIWPSPIKAVKNFWFSKLMGSYYDEHFTQDTFTEGALQAVKHVSQCISRGDWDSLSGLVTPDAIREIQSNYANLSAKQRDFLAIRLEDVYYKFIYEIGMIFDDGSDQRFVEITFVLQGIEGLQETTNFQEAMNQVHPDRNFVCNYRFIREFTKGKEDQWTINKLNHFMPKDIVESTGMFDR